MNYSMIRFILGRMLRIEGLVLLIPAFVSLIYQEHSGLTFVLTAALLMAPVSYTHLTLPTIGG